MKKTESHKSGADIRRLALLAMLLGVSAALSALESMFPPIPLAPPGMRLGLANAATMYALFFVGKKQAFALAAMKSVFVLLARGPVAAMLSAAGGMLSLAAIIAASGVSKKLSYVALSSVGAVAHNFGQLAAASLLLGHNFVALHWPLVLLFGTALGAVTGAALEAALVFLGGRRFGK